MADVRLFRLERDLQRLNDNHYTTPDQNSQDTEIAVIAHDNHRDCKTVKEIALLLKESSSARSTLIHHRDGYMPDNDLYESLTNGIRLLDMEIESLIYRLSKTPGRRNQYFF